ncbi:hypothetical protein D9M68_708960 [compost metagenome]
MVWLMSEGVMLRNACGRITCRMACPGDIPSDCAACIWPARTLPMPARMISQ